MAEGTTPVFLELLMSLLDDLAQVGDRSVDRAIESLKGLIQHFDATSGQSQIQFDILQSELAELVRIRDQVLHDEARQTLTSKPGMTSGLFHPFKQTIERVLDLLEKATKSSSSYEAVLQHAIEEWKQAREMIRIQEMTQRMVDAGGNVLQATREFQSGLGEIAQATLTYQHRINELEGQLKEQKALAMTDALTGLYNRRAFDLRLPECVAHARRFSTEMCLFFVDIDEFKNVNDRYGHQAGDDVLVNFALLLRRNSREYDAVFRFGGDEFAIILPNADLDHARHFVTRLQRFVGEKAYRYRDQGREVLFHVNISGGLVQLREGEDSESLIKRADEQLYQAKRTGKNKICWE